MFDRTHSGFIDFIRESNRIEGILRDPTEDEIAAHERLLGACPSNRESRVLGSEILISSQLANDNGNFDS